MKIFHTCYVRYTRNTYLLEPYAKSLFIWENDVSNAKLIPWGGGGWLCIFHYTLKQGLKNLHRLHQTCSETSIKSILKVAPVAPTVPFCWSERSDIVDIVDIVNLLYLLFQTESYVFEETTGQHVCICAE